MGKDADTIKLEIEQTRARMNDTVEALGYKADVGSRVREGVQSQADSVKDAIGDVVKNVKTAVVGAGQTMNGAVAETARGGFDSVGSLNESLRSALPNVDVAGNTSRAVGIVKENPIGLALASLAIGFLVGSLVPVSEIERKQLQPLRDKVVDQAQHVTQDLVAAGKAVITETAQSVFDTARSSAQTHASQVVAAAKDRAEQS